ncbi:hypothetical protein AV530_001755 [Patagioenas fasciata monilis]|uniref:Uncharacterized protein n=1 Tax=Patagioenas fasciata monilis TaxID=372326 RepID=A0A1V4KMC6_PATFA|nr:hypothetical protein AV530_001755 [Patagioenas fasciata monilis]
MLTGFMKVKPFIRACFQPVSNGRAYTSFLISTEGTSDQNNHNFTRCFWQRFLQGNLDNTTTVELVMAFFPEGPSKSLVWCFVFLAAESGRNPVFNILLHAYSK